MKTKLSTLILSKLTFSSLKLTFTLLMLAFTTLTLTLRHAAMTMKTISSAKMRVNSWHTPQWWTSQQVSLLA